MKKNEKLKREMYSDYSKDDSFAMPDSGSYPAIIQGTRSRSESINDGAIKKINPKQKIIRPVTSLTDNEIVVTLRHNLLVFKTIDDYRKVIDNPSDKFRNSFLQKVDSLGFVSYAKALGDKLITKNLIEDTYFESILNPSCCVQIADYVYKIKKENETVLVFHASNFHFSNINDPEYGNSVSARTYSTNQDVLACVEFNLEEALSWCSNPSCSSEQKPGTPYISPVYNPAFSAYTNYVNNTYVTNPVLVTVAAESGQMNSQIEYSTFGIYFSLKAKGRLTVANRRIELHRIPVYWKQKCGSTSGPNYSWNYILTSPYTPTNIGLWYTYYAYQGSKGLTKIWFKVIFMAKFTPYYYYPDPSVILEIKQNYP